MIKALFRLIRLYYSLPFSLGFIVIVYYLTGGKIINYLDLILAVSVLFGVISGGYVLNDVCDIDADRINEPSKVLPSKKIKRKSAFIFSITLFFSAILISLLIFNLKFFIGIVLVISLLVFYDIFSKKLGILKEIIVAILMTSLYPLAFIFKEPVQTPRLNVLFIHPFWLFMTAMGYEMLKDVRDHKGDEKIATVLSVCRQSWFLKLSKFLLFAGSLITLIPYILGFCKEIYLATAISAVILAGVAIFKKPVKAIPLIYIEVFLITAGSMADLIVYGP